MARAHINPADVGDRRIVALDAALHRQPVYSVGAIDPADETAVSKAPRRGAGQRCNRCREREGTRVAGWSLSDLWRCEVCPEPAPLEISAELDPAGKDPHRRHAWSRYRSAAEYAAGERDDLEDA